MSETSDELHELQDDELENVSGGNPAIPMILGTWFLTGMFAGDGLGSAHLVAHEQLKA